MSLDNDYERFSYDVVKFILDRAEYKPTDALCKAVADKLMQGPQFTMWPHDVAQANLRARERAHALAQRRPELPRLPALPGLPRPLPALPRPLGLPPLPRLLKP